MLQKSFSQRIKSLYNRQLFLITGVFLFVLVPFITVVYTYTRPNLSTVSAQVPATLNFQARLTTGAGAIVPDGTYNVEFKLYDALTGGTNLWTETRLTTDAAALRVVVRAGYLSVYLGDKTPFGSINFGQQLYLTMNIGGTAVTPTWDGEMTPRLRLTSVPYAFNTNQLNGRTSDQFVQLDPGATPQTTNTTNSAIAVNQQGTGNILQLQSNGNNALLLQANGNLTIDPNAGTDPTFFIDAVNNRVGIGTATPVARLSLAGSGYGNGLVFNNSLSTAIGLEGTNILSVLNSNTGGSIQVAAQDFFRVVTNSSERLRVTQAGNVGIGTASPNYPLHVQRNFTNTNNTHQIVVDPTYTFNTNGGYFNSGIQSYTTLAGTANNTFNSLGMYAAIDNRNTGTSANVIAGAFEVYNYAASGTITKATGVNGFVGNFAGGTIQDAYGVWAGVDNALGTINNAYGVYIDGIQGTNTWGLYQADATADNYFAGNVGIGTATPDFKLDVRGTTLLSTGGTAPFGTAFNDPSTALLLYSDSSYSYNLIFADGSAGGFVANDLTFGFKNPSGIFQDAFSLLQETNDSNNVATRTFSIFDPVAGARRLRVRANGNIGIGAGAVTTTPIPSVLAVSEGRIGEYITTLRNTSATGNGLLVETQGNATTNFALQVRTNIGGTPIDAFTVRNDGRVGTGTTTPGARLHVQNTSAATVGSIIQGAASQTADLLQIKNSAGANLVVVNAAGNVTITNNLTVNGSFTLGASGTPLTQMRVYTPTLNPGSVPASSAVEQTYTVTGLAVGDIVTINKPSQTGNCIIGNVRVSATDTLAVTWANPGAIVACDPPSETYIVMAVRS